MKSDSQLFHLSSRLLLLSFVNRWVEVSDCNESQNRRKNRAELRTHQQSHMATHTLSLHQMDAILCFHCYPLSSHFLLQSYLHVCVVCANRRARSMMAFCT